MISQEQKIDDVVHAFTSRELEHLLFDTARDHHVTLAELVASRSPLPTKARRAVMDHLRMLGFSYVQIGKLMLVDHTTVLYHARHADREEAARAAKAAEDRKRIRSKHPDKRGVNRGNSAKIR